MTLLGTESAIWRRLLVPAAVTLVELHQVLQTAMGWEDEHLHEFRNGRLVFERPQPMSGFMDETTEDERAITLGSVLGRVGAKFEYTYDFGDNWEQGIVLEKRLAADPNVMTPVCTGGKEACPPEDRGGVHGFYNLREAILDPNHKDDEEMLDWIGEYDPDAFSLDAVNSGLARLRRPRMKAAKN